ncbi:MAG: gamma-glutamyl-gamma-aminobutyrate hydrolase family protein [candidate division Zixibacteria bacterium]|nr:gamma-glutamyl-gamma-aminobutyrate hydrolase family protein [candidate division Zixibacteria bacterium]
MTRPVIGVVLALTAEDHDFVPQPAYRFEFLKEQYYEAIEEQGALPIGIPATERLDTIEQYCDIITGLLLVGGEDVNPSTYGEELDPLGKPMMPRRDQFECRMVAVCHERQIPILGICRGLQIMNAAFGGTLYQDLSQMPSAANHGQVGELDFSTRHQVEIVPGTRLHQIVGADHIETNTGHHQGIKQLANGLTVSAKTADGVIEAIEGNGFTIAVQWHPEAWSCDPYSRKLFAGFCEAGTTAIGRKK